MSKPILCLDFDGVLHSYTSGWQGADVIPDEPVDGALGFIVEAIEEFDVCIYSSRSGQEGGIAAMQQWMTNRLYEALDPQDAEQYDAIDELVKDTIKWPTEKPPAFVSIDDRCLLFDGTFPDMEFLKNFKPWNKREG